MFERKEDVSICNYEQKKIGQVIMKLMALFS